MSAPKTNVKKQGKRHKGPLGGLIWVVAFALVLLGVLALWVVAGGNEPANDEPVDGAAVTEEPAEAAAE